MNPLTRIKYFIANALKWSNSYWKLDEQGEAESCVFYTSNFWAENMEEEKRQFENENRLAFYWFFLEYESRYQYHYSSTILIDPYRGWLINEKNNKLFPRSFPYHNNPFSGTIYYPSVWKYLNPFKKVKEVKQAISIPYGWENYFHFFIETLPQLVMLDELNIDKEIPVIIPHRATTFQYVRDFMELNNLFGQRTLIIQQADEYIRVREGTQVFKDIGYPKEALVQLLKSFKNRSFLDNQGSRKVFLKRAANIQRAIVNTAELEEYLSESGYEIVNAEGMSLQAQIDLFSSCSKIVGIHGAGLTNMLFRYGRPLEILEIFPEGHAPEHYKILSATLGFSYSSITGGPFDANKQFVLPLEKLKAVRSL